MAKVPAKKKAAPAKKVAAKKSIQSTPAVKKPKKGSTTKELMDKMHETIQQHTS